MSEREDEPAGLAQAPEESRRLLELAAGPVDIAPRLGHVRCAEQAAGTGDFGCSGSHCKRALVPARRLGNLAACPPEAPDRSREHQCVLAVSTIARVRERFTYVVFFESDALVPPALLGSREIRFGLFDECEIEHEVTFPKVLTLIVLIEQAGGV